MKHRQNSGRGSSTMRSLSFIICLARARSIFHLECGIGVGGCSDKPVSKVRVLRVLRLCVVVVVVVVSCLDPFLSLTSLITFFQPKSEFLPLTAFNAFCGARWMSHTHSQMNSHTRARTRTRHMHKAHATTHDKERSMHRECFRCTNKASSETSSLSSSTGGPSARLYRQGSKVCTSKHPHSDVPHTDTHMRAHTHI